MYLSILSGCMYFHCMHDWRPEEGAGFPETAVTHACKLPCCCWEQNLGSLQEQCVLFTTKSSLHHHLKTYLQLFWNILVLCIRWVTFVTEHHRTLCVNFFRKHIVLGIYVVYIFVLGSKYLELVIDSVSWCGHLVSPFLNGCLDPCLTQLVML